MILIVQRHIRLYLYERIFLSDNTVLLTVYRDGTVFSWQYTGSENPISWDPNYKLTKTVKTLQIVTKTSRISAEILVLSLPFFLNICFSFDKLYYQLSEFEVCRSTLFTPRMPHIGCAECVLYKHDKRRNKYHLSWAADTCTPSRWKTGLPILNDCIEMCHF